MSREYISCADTAKLIRQAIKEAFPGVKFSVRSHVYSGGASITVEWLDGPNEQQVETVTNRFEASYFDGSIDFKGSIFHMLDGKPVRFGADSIRCNRSNSDEAIERAISRVYRTFAENFERDGIACPTVAQYRNGALFNLQLSGLHTGSNTQTVQQDIRAALYKSSDRLAGKTSKTAGRVFTTHDDGYSRSCGSGFAAVTVDSFHVKGATKNA